MAVMNKNNEESNSLYLQRQGLSSAKFVFIEKVEWVNEYQIMGSWKGYDMKLDSRYWVDFQPWIQWQ